MNAKFVFRKIDIGDIVRITTDQAVGVIGRVLDIDIDDDGIELEGLRGADELKQIDNPIEFETSIFPISDIKWIFKLKLENKIN